MLFTLYGRLHTDDRADDDHFCFPFYMGSCTRRLNLLPIFKQGRTSRDFNENQTKHQNRNFLKTFCNYLWWNFFILPAQPQDLVSDSFLLTHPLQTDVSCFSCVLYTSVANGCVLFLLRSSFFLLLLLLLSVNRAYLMNHWTDFDETWSQ